MKYKKKKLRLEARIAHWVKYPKAPHSDHERTKPGSVNGK